MINQVERDIKTLFFNHFDISLLFIESILCPGFTSYFFEIEKDNQKATVDQMGKEVAYMLRAPGGQVIIEKNKKSLLVEVPNRYLYLVYLNNLLEKYKKSGLNYKLPIVIGIDNKNKEIFADLVDLKHLVLAGQTGSGKSMFEDTVICTLLSIMPENIKLLLSDVKRVEFDQYKDIPQLISKIIVEPKVFFKEVEKLIKEKEKRLKSNYKNYPYIVAVFDTISDITFTNQNLFDNLMKRLLKDAVEAKIHIIVSDSRPQDKVFTPTIMSLMPTKLCFAMASFDNSNFFIGNKNGHYLLGRGDGLLLKSNKDKLIRIQTPYISNEEIEKIIHKV